LIPEVFFPAVVFPGLLIVVLYLYPFLEEALTRDRRSHNVLRIPTQHPFNTALGCAVFSCLVLLEFAGADDVLAMASSGSVVALRLLFRVLVFVVPIAIGVVVYALCWLARRKHAEASLPAEGAPQPR